MSLRVCICLLLFFSALFFFVIPTHFPHFNTHVPTHVPPHVLSAISHCQQLQLKAGPSREFYRRNHSDRYTPGTRPTLLKHARIWTGEKNGTDIIRGDVLLDKGLIKAVGHVPSSAFEAFKDNLVVIDVQNAWVTPGIVDMHSHIGNSAAPELTGASEDYNSNLGNIQPWLRSLDGLNTHDRSYELSISGGITSALVLPGSGNAIGGQGFVIKLRNTAERSPTSMLLEPPQQTNSSMPNASSLPQWRHMKHACGENPSKSYLGTRMDTIWALREAYNNAKALREAQDMYCAKATTGKWDTLGDFPEDLRWEALVDVLRGRVKVHIHCYEAVDLDDLVHLSNEFRFPIAAFHHASEAYLVPSVLKTAYGGPPGVALFATNARYKREAYRTSEFAPRILAEHGLKVAMKSDHPVLNSRHLLYEAQQAYFYGLPAHQAIASVTSTPSLLLGLDHRIGFVKAGWDADLVVWDSHPLALGATPTQVFIDGSAQLQSPYVVHKSRTFQKLPKVPSHDREAAEAIEYEGLPPLAPKAASSDAVLFKNVRNLFVRKGSSVQNVLLIKGEERFGVVVVRNGVISCSGMLASCSTKDILDAHIVDLQGGSISPGLISFGSPLGLEHIAAEASTNDGTTLDPLTTAVPKVFGPGAVAHAVDGLQFASRDALLAYRAGVTTAITAPTHKGFYSGLSTVFSLGVLHKMEGGAVIKDVAGLHVSIRHFGGKPSVSSQIAALRHLLLEPSKAESAEWFQRVIQGKTPLVVDAHSQDIIATLILLKKEVESVKGAKIKMTITGASEAHLLAAELREAGVGVIISPSRPFPNKWEDRRILPGPPLTKSSAITELWQNNVTVGIGIQEIWNARNTRFDLAWAAIEAGGRLTQEDALMLASTNLEKLISGDVDDAGTADLVATEGGDLLNMSSKVVAIISPRHARVDLF